MSNIKPFRIKSVKEKKSILSLDKISFKFGRKIILDNLNLKLNNGQILRLLGATGAGKSTIFNLITGLLSPYFGSIMIISKVVNEFPISQRTLNEIYLPPYKSAVNAGVFSIIFVFPRKLAVGLYPSNHKYSTFDLLIIVFLPHKCIFFSITLSKLWG